MKAVENYENSSKFIDENDTKTIHLGRHTGTTVMPTPGWCREYLNGRET
jgi:hypothetical protein